MTAQDIKNLEVLHSGLIARQPKSSPSGMKSEDPLMQSLARVIEELKQVARP